MTTRACAKAQEMLMLRHSPRTLLSKSRCIRWAGADPSALGGVRVGLSGRNPGVDTEPSDPVVHRVDGHVAAADDQAEPDIRPHPSDDPLSSWDQASRGRLGPHLGPLGQRQAAPDGASDTTMTSSTSSTVCCRVKSDTCGALRVVTIDVGVVDTGSAAVNASNIAVAPSVSTPQIRISGASERNAVATPAISPPPPILTRTSVRSVASWTNSSPTVPCPATTAGSSNGCTGVSPAATRSSSSRKACLL